MTRFKAFGIHLGISLFIFILVLGLLILVWYPWPLFDLEGGWQGIRLVALVDVVLGPVLTLILFKVGKPGLKFDISLVVILQVGALIYGMWNLYEARPVLLVHADDHFRPLSRNLVAEWDDTGKVLAQWERITPQKVRVDVPDDPFEFADFFRQSQGLPGGLHGLAVHYQPLQETWDKALRDAVRIEPYVEKVAEWKERLKTLLDSLGQEANELAFFPYVGRRERLFLVFDRDAPRIRGVLDIPYDPVRALAEVPRSKRGAAPEPEPATGNLGRTREGAKDADNETNLSGRATTPSQDSYLTSR